MQSRVVLADIDECALSPDPCGSYATCEDTDGSYDCKCKPGYRHSGTDCEGELVTTLLLMDRWLALGDLTEFSKRLAFFTRVLYYLYEEDQISRWNVS